MIAVNVPRANVRLSASSAATLLPFEPYTMDTASSSTAVVLAGVDDDRHEAAAVTGAADASFCTGGRLRIE